MTKLHDAYRPLRPSVTPFPGSSVIAWYFILSLQREMGVTGDDLEIGVENGGTAFLLLAEASEEESVLLVDRKRTESFDIILETVGERYSRKLEFFLCSSFSPDLAPVAAKQFRFIHVDGGHSKKDVLSDLLRFSDSVALDGVLCLDDVFTPRWPGVTEALFEFMPSSHLQPLLMVDRKLYLAQKKFSDRYRDMITRHSRAVADAMNGQVWEQPFFGVPMSIMAFSTHRDLFTAPLFRA